MVASPRLMSSTYNLACFRTTSPMALNGFVIGGGRAIHWQRQRAGLGARRFKHQSAQCSFLEKTASGALLKNSPCNCARPLS
ncbi:hypothetical protein GGD62_001467 [Bradyrhizobium sp. ERR14]|nr:hypothetical protein [Bradyrhizobium sp. ERR14]